jgi:hypothetical protein
MRLPSDLTPWCITYRYNMQDYPHVVTSLSCLAPGNDEVVCILYTTASQHAGILRSGDMQGI